MCKKRMFGQTFQELMVKPEIMSLLILTILFCPGVWILLFFLENVKIPTLHLTPPPSGLTLIGALGLQTF